MSKIGIVVLNWNGKEDTAKCLQSLRTLTYPATVFLVDNGSTDGSVALFREKFPTVRLIETGLNLGYAGGNNVGIELALKEGCEYVFILNNDTVVAPGIIEAFLQGFEDPTVGILGGKILRMDEPEVLDHIGGLWNKRKMDFEYIGYRAKQVVEPQQLDYVCGAALMIKKEVFETIGLFDPRFFLFWEEADFCLRAKRAGFCIRFCPAATLWHKISASFSGGKPHASYFLSRNRLLWIEKNILGAKKWVYFTRLLLGRYPLFFLSKQLRQLQRMLQVCTGKSSDRNRERIKRINSTLVGMEDYLMRRFYSGRSKKFMNCD